MIKIKRNIVLLICFIIVSLIYPIHVRAASIKLNKTEATICVGDTCRLKVEGTSKAAVWGSSNKKIAVVNSKGKVTSKKAGSATIRAKVGNRILRCKINVRILAVNKSKLTITDNGSLIVTSLCVPLHILKCYQQ